jgi:hypothetical protein
MFSNPIYLFFDAVLFIERESRARGMLTVSGEEVEDSAGLKISAASK